MNPFAQLLSMLISVYVSIILLRFFLQYFRADFYNPLSQFIVKITDPLVKPVRKLVPSLAGLDLSTLLLAWFFTCLKIFISYGMNTSMADINWLMLGLYSILVLIQSILGLFMLLIIVRAVASWIAPGGYNPALAVVGQLAEPLISKARKLIPPMSGIDLSPMFVLLVIYFIDYSITYYFF